MHCRTCRARMELEDNYCRKCGAAVDILDVEVVRSSQARSVSTLRSAAVPVVAQGAAMLVAGTLARLALRLLVTRGDAAVRSVLPFGRREAAAGEVVEEVFYYRRSRSR